MLERIRVLFVGKKVRITHTNKRDRAVQGVCKAIHQVPGEINRFNLELQNGSRYGFMPEVVTATYVDGELHAATFCRRKIEVIKP